MCGSTVLAGTERLVTIRLLPPARRTQGTGGAGPGTADARRRPDAAGHSRECLSATGQIAPVSVERVRFRASRKRSRCPCSDHEWSATSPGRVSEGPGGQLDKLRSSGPVGWSLSRNVQCCDCRIAIWQAGQQ